MSAEAELVEPQDRHLWEASALRGTHAQAFVSACARALGAEARLWVWRDGQGGRAACPVLLRPLDGGRFDVATPFGFGGLTTHQLSRDWQEAWHSSWARLGAVSAYIQCAPGEAPPAESNGVRSGPSNARWSIQMSEHELEAGLRRDHRARLRQWLRTHPRVEIDTNAARDAFCSLYPDFAARRGVSQPYRLSTDALRSISESDSFMVVAAGETGSDLTASALFAWRGQGAEYVLNGSSQAGRDHARGLLWTAALCLKERGVAWIDLGGGVSPGDQLESFKVRFGARLVPTQIRCDVFDKLEYARRCNANGYAPDSLGYFPAYRRSE